MIYDSSVALGEAYVVVRADLRGFNADLKKQLKKAVDDVERDVNGSVGKSAAKTGEKAAKKVGDDVAKSMKKALTNQNPSLFTKISSALAGALDDGISALPMQVKAAIVAGLIAVSPLVAAGLAGAVSAGVGIGVVGLGVALASQYEDVQARFATFATNIRQDLVAAAEPFAPALIKAMDTVEARIHAWGPLLKDLFSQSSPLLDTLTEGALGAVENILFGIQNSMGDLSEFTEIAAEGFTELGSAIGDAIKILSSTGEGGRQGLRDIITLTAESIRGFAAMVFFLTKIYELFHDITELVTNNPIFEFFDQFIPETGRVQTSLWGANEAAANFDGTTQLLISSTKREEKAAKDAANALKLQRKALDETRDATFRAFQANIDFERGLDEIADTLKRNGKTFDITKEKGRENLEVFENEIIRAQERAEAFYEQGKLNSVEARQFYQDEINQIYQVAAASGVSKKELDKIYSRLIELVNLPPIDAALLETLRKQAKATANEMERTLFMAARIRALTAAGVPGNPIPWGAGHIEGFADGGMVTRDSVVRAGEGNRPEVIIPLTKPARAAQLAERSGLARMLGNLGNTLVQVFVGDEPLTQKMYRVVESNNRWNALALAQGQR